MSPEVFSEITKIGYPGAAYFSTLGEKTQNRAGQIILQEPGPSDHPLFLQNPFLAMGKGEQETIQMFCNLTRFGLADAGDKTKDFILVDDGRAAKFCHVQQIPFINALLVPKIFWYSGFMDQKKYLNKTAQLCELGRYSKRVMEMAGQLSRKKLTYFIGGDSHEC